MSASEGLDGKQILLIGEFLYATAAWDSLSALGRLRVRGHGNDPPHPQNLGSPPHCRYSYYHNERQD